MDEKPKLPLRSREGTTLQLLHGLVQVQEDTDENCHDRLIAAGRMRDFHRVRTQVANIIRDLMDTIPEERKRMFLYNLEHQEMAIRTKSDGLSKEAGYLYVPVESLLMLEAITAKMRCDLCDGTHEDMRSCKLRKCLNDMTVIDFESGIGGECKWSGFNWEGIANE